jgi:MFS family permease
MKKNIYIEVLSKYCEYRKLFIADLISRFGDSIDSIAFTWLVYQITGKASWSALVFAFNMLPTVLVQPFGGVAVEHRNQKKILVLTDAVRAVLVIGLMLLCVINRVQPWMLIVFTLMISTVEAFGLPAGVAIIPKVIEIKDYGTASSLMTSASRVVELIGMGAAGILIGQFGIWVAMAIDAATFAISAFIISTLKPRENEKDESVNESFFTQLKGGMTYLTQNTIVRNLCALGILANAVLVPFNSLLTPWICEALGQDSNMLSAFNIALIIGMAIGALLITKLKKLMSIRLVITLSGMLIGILIYFDSKISVLFHGVFPIYMTVIIAALFLGIFAGIMTTMVQIQFMQCTEQNYLARVAALFNSLATAAIPITSFIISILASRFEVVQIFAACGIVCLIVFVALQIGNIKVEKTDDTERV